MKFIKKKSSSALKTSTQKLTSKQMTDSDSSKSITKKGHSYFCYNCNSKKLCRQRNFSDQVWTVLLLWNEIRPLAVHKQLCDECYSELREILIDRTDEIEAASKKTDSSAKASLDKVTRLVG